MSTTQTKTPEAAAVYAVVFDHGQAEAVGYALRQAMRRLRDSGVTDEHALDLLSRLDAAERKLDEAPVTR